MGEFGGSRHGKWKTVRNLMATMLLGGLWHGAAWTFVIWGGIHGAAQAVSRVLTVVVHGLFAAAAKLPFGNPVSNANRAVDHLWAYGSGWMNAPAPLTISGNELPRELLEAASDIVGRFPALPEHGYLG